MQNEEFAGARKTNNSFLTPFERRLSRVVVPRIPPWIETQHLTMLTLLWSTLIVLFGYLAARNIRWLWLVSLMIAFQYITDHYDGKLGKYRQTGLVRWGYYMDHLLDYFFLCAVIMAYTFILPVESRYQLLLLLALFGGYDLATFLAFSATDKLQISYLRFGPTEFRLALIIINALLVVFGKRYMVSGLKYVNAGALLGLCLLVYQAQKGIWDLDMEAKRQREGQHPRLVPEPGTAAETGEKPVERANQIGKVGIEVTPA
jgi:phosphatidylglycerophosphate synthase